MAREIEGEVVAGQAIGSATAANEVEADVLRDAVRVNHIDVVAKGRVRVQARRTNVIVNN